MVFDACRANSGMQNWCLGGSIPTCSCMEWNGENTNEITTHHLGMVKSISYNGDKEALRGLDY